MVATMFSTISGSWPWINPNNLPHLIKTVPATIHAVAFAQYALSISTVAFSWNNEARALK